MYHRGGNSNYKGRNNNARYQNQQNYVHHTNVHTSPIDTSNLLGANVNDANAYNQSGYDSKVSGYQYGRGGNNFNFHDDNNMTHNPNNENSFNAKNYNKFKKINDNTIDRTQRQRRRDRQKQRRGSKGPQFQSKRNRSENKQSSEIRQENNTLTTDTVAATNISKPATPPPSLLSIKVEKVKQENKIKETSVVSVKQEKAFSNETVKPSLEIQNKEKSSSESSDTSSSSEDSPVKETVKKNVITPNPDPRNEDVVCLGHIENKFSIDDEDHCSKEDSGEELGEKSIQDSTTNDSNQTEKCVLCDKIGHTSFQCQMICKNCAGSYHNLKTCPKPPNLSIMLQSFMEFCTLQIGFFNPELKFDFNPNISHNVAYTMQSSTNSDRKHKRRSTQKDTPKKSSKTKRKPKNTDKDEESSENSTSSDDSSTSSDSEVGSTRSSKKHKKKRLKKNSISASESAAYTTNPFMTHTGLPQFPLPNFSTAAAYNPTLFTQMLHSAFPGHGQLNFNK